MKNGRGKAKDKGPASGCTIGLTPPKLPPTNPSPPITKHLCTDTEVVEMRFRWTSIVVFSYREEPFILVYWRTTHTKYTTRILLLK